MCRETQTHRRCSSTHWGSGSATDSHAVPIDGLGPRARLGWLRSFAPLSCPAVDAAGILPLIASPAVPRVGVVHDPRFGHQAVFVDRPALRVVCRTDRTRPSRPRATSAGLFQDGTYFGTAHRPPAAFFLDTCRACRPNELGIRRSPEGA
jgi:hypothetical protein